MNRPVLALAALLLAASSLPAQQPDPRLSAYVDSIPAIDNHAHVIAPANPGDRDYDALPCDALPASSGPGFANLRFSPDDVAAWQALWGFTATGDSPQQLREVEARRAAARRKLGLGYDDWVLRRANVATVLANRLAMAPGLSAPHFLWVPYDDALLFPLDNSLAANRNPDRHVFFRLEEAILKDYVRESGQQKLPATLDGYLDGVVTPTLERQKKSGAVAIKFEVAYLRALDFRPTSKSAADDVYERHIGGATPGLADYKTLQDFLFGYIAAEAGRLGMAVHIHTGIGCGDYFDVRGSDPMLLEPVLNDPALRHTNFVLLHGGTPFNREVAGLIVKPNVYVDTSLLELLFSPAEMARILRPWLEIMPEKVLYGSDAGPLGPSVDWEEGTWIGSRHARQALALALSGMVREHAISASRARAIARGILHDNAAALYHLPEAKR
jgi:hypothetical protein